MNRAASSSSSAAKVARAVPGRASPKGFNRSSGVIDPLSAQQAKTKSLIVNTVPRTATPSDIQRELLERELIPPNFPLQNITMPYISLGRPRFVNLSRQVHIQLDDHDQAFTMFSALRKAPLFNFRRNNIERTCDFTNFTAKKWHQQQIEDFKEENSDWRPTNPGLKEGEDDRISKDLFPRAIAPGQKLEGKVVLLRGLPPKIPNGMVGRVVSKYVLQSWHAPPAEAGLSSGPDAVMYLPPSGSRMISWYALQFETAAQAHRAARHLNMVTYSPPPRDMDSTPPTYLLQAEVQY